MLKKEGESAGRHQARSLIKEAGLKSKQYKKHRYILAENESKIAPNHLNRKFNVSDQNRAWCGDVSYIWSGEC